MRADLARRLTAAGFADVEIRIVLSPPWTTDWITGRGPPQARRGRDRAARPAPRGRPAGGPVPLTLSPARPRPTCPACGSPDTTLTAAFGATACRDLYRCQTCGEPFDHVKEI